MKTKTEIKKEYMKKLKAGAKAGWFSEKAGGYLNALVWVLELSKKEEKEIIQDVIEKQRR